MAGTTATKPSLDLESEKSRTGTSINNPLVLDDNSDSETNESIYSKFGLSTALSGKTQSIPILPSSSPRKQSIERSEPSKPTSTTDTKKTSLPHPHPHPHPRPSQRYQSSALFHNAKKPDIRAAERKPVLHSYTSKTPLNRSTNEAIDLTSEPAPKETSSLASKHAVRISSPIASTSTSPNKAIEPTTYNDSLPNSIGPKSAELTYKVKTLDNRWELWRTHGRDFFVDHRTKGTQWHEPTEAASSPHPRADARSSGISNRNRAFLIVDPTHSRRDVLSTQIVQQPTPKPSTSVSRSPSPIPHRTPTKTADQPSSQVSVVIQKSPAIPYESYQDLSRKRRLIEPRGYVPVKRLRHNSSSSSSIVSHHDLHSFYTYDEDDDRRRRVAQTKVKSVNRADIPLDFGNPAPSATKRLDLKSLVRPEAQVQQIHRAQFKNVVGPPLTFCNEVNGTFLNENFRFISAFRKRPGVVEGSPDGDIVCDCTGDCASLVCACVKEGDQPYRVKGDGLVVLRDEFVEPPQKAIKKEMEHTIHDEENTDDDQDERPPVIYECNFQCSCGPRCKNRVIQKGRILPLEIFMTKMCGFGVRCPVSVAKGQFIDIYLGELMTTAELDDREEVRDTAYPNLTSYSFTLDRFKDELNEQREGKPKIQMYQVDATKFGCPTRFINHSCEPNCRVYPSLIRLTDRRVYNLAFFATRSIDAYEELTIDYDPEGAGTVWDENDFSDEPDMKRCYCGAATCRKLLWAPPPSRKRGRPRLYGI